MSISYFAECTVLITGASAGIGREFARQLAPVVSTMILVARRNDRLEAKGVVVTLRCLTTFLDWMLKEQKFAHAGETFLNQAPFSFDLSVMDLYLSLATAGTLFSLQQDQIVNLKGLYIALRESAVTTWVSTPTFAQMCLVERGFDQTMLPQLRRFLFCGETLAPETASQLLDRFPETEVWNSYGPRRRRWHALQCGLLGRQ